MPKENSNESSPKRKSRCFTSKCMCACGLEAYMYGISRNLDSREGATGLIPQIFMRHLMLIVLYSLKHKTCAIVPTYKP